jgi:hypothetical protein
VHPGRRIPRALATVARAAAIATVCAATIIGTVAGPAPTHVNTAEAATASPTSSPNAPTRVRITLDSLDPKVVEPGNTLTLDGVLLNTSGLTLDNVSVVLRVSTRRIGTRFDLSHDTDPNTVIGTVIQSTQQILGVLAPGGSVSWHIALPIQQLAMPTGPGDFGVYPIEVEAGTTAAGNGGRERTRMPTFITWMPTGAQFTPTQVSWVWPLVDGIHRSSGNTFTDDALAKDLAPTGRVGSLLSIATSARVPITYAIDPALVDDATVMAASAVTASAAPGAPTAAGASGAAAPSAPSTSTTAKAKSKAKTKAATSPPATPAAAAAPSTYQVDEGAGTVPGVGADVAAQFLAQLKAAVADPGSAVIGLPYGDADMVALDRAGLDREIDIARSTGQTTLDSQLGPAAGNRILSDVVWPVSGVIDESTLSDLAGDLVSTVLLQDSALPPRDANAVTGVRADLQTASGPIGAVLSDSALDNVVADPAAVPGGVRAAEQLYLAQTMLITELRPGAGSSVVITPPRNWTPNTAFVQDLLDDSAAVPWLRGVDLSAITAQASDGVARAPLVYPDAARDAELPTSGLAEIGTLRQELASFGSMLGSSTTEPFLTTASTTLLRAESAGLRSDPDQAAVIRHSVQNGLDSLADKVTISNPKLITLTGRKNKIPITVVNNLPDPITISISVVATNTARLRVEPVPTFIVDGHGTRHTALVTVEPRTSGRFEVTAQLMTPETTPRPFGPPISFEMNSTAYGTVALAIAGGAAALLFLLSGIRLVRRYRRHLLASRTPNPAVAGEPS